MYLPQKIIFNFYLSANRSQEMEDREKSSDNSGLLKLGATRARLHRGCTTQADAGTYTCVAEAGFKSISSSTAVVIG